MQKTEFSLPSSANSKQLHGIHWACDAPPRAVVQLVHGMMEYVDRYDRFARFLASRNIAVIGHDHLGHGKTATTSGELGFFHEKNGDSMVIQDIRQITSYCKKQYPNLPIFLMGHSMGSFFARDSITQYGKEYAGVILMGTGYHTTLELTLGLHISHVLMALKGPTHRSALLHQIVLGGNNRSFKGKGKTSKTPSDWLSRDTKCVALYCKDPLCTFKFTNSAYYDFFTIMLRASKKQNLENIPKALPILLISGEKDSVGNMGKGVIKVCQQLSQYHLDDLSMKLFPDARHELLNELNEKEVCKYLLSWLNRHL